MQETTKSTSDSEVWTIERAAPSNRYDYQVWGQYASQVLAVEAARQELRTEPNAYWRVLSPKRTVVWAGFLPNLL